MQTLSMTASGESKTLQWVLKRKHLWIGGGVVLLAVALLLGLGRHFTEKKTLEASIALHAARKLQEKEVREAGSTPITDVDRQLTATAGALKELTRKYDGVSVAWEARFLLAGLYLQYEARSGKAVSAFEATVEAARSAREKVFALYSLAHAHEAQGHFEEAIQKIDAAVAMKQSFLKGELALTRARLLDRAGKGAEAATAFDLVAKDFADTTVGQKASQWKALRSAP